MAKNIEMQILNSDSSYEVLYPQTVSDITLNSEYLKNLWNLGESSTVDDAFDYVQRQLLLIQYKKAGVNVTLLSAGGSPLEGIKINGITASYDGTGECRTDSQGKCFGYCDAGNVTVSCDTFTDLSVTSQQINAIATQMYNVSLTGTVATNFIKWISTTNAIFSNNVQSIDVTCVGGGGGGGGGFSDGRSRFYSGGGGGGGYCVVQETVPFNIETSYPVVVGAGGNGSAESSSSLNNGGNGGTSSFLSVSANGGGGGRGSYYSSYDGSMTWGIGGTGNGNGGNYVTHGQGNSGGSGTVAGYSSFTETVIYGGGGGSGAAANTSYNAQGFQGGSAGGYGGNGGRANNLRDYPSPSPGGNGQNGFGGGGGTAGIVVGEQREGDSSYRTNIAQAGSGGSGCVAIRMHLKVVS